MRANTSVWLEPELKLAAQSAARAAGLTLSGFIRAVIRGALDTAEREAYTDDAKATPSTETRPTSVEHRPPPPSVPGVGHPPAADDLDALLAELDV